MKKKLFYVTDLPFIYVFNLSLMLPFLIPDTGISLVVCGESLFDATTHTPGQYIQTSTILLSGIPRTEQATKGSELSFLALNQSSNVLRTRICPAYYLNSPSLDAFLFFFFRATLFLETTAC